MKQIIIFSVLFLSLLFTSCNDDVDLANQENTVEYTVTSDDPDAVIHVEATGLSAKGIDFKHEFTNKCVTKDYFVVVKASCDDPVVVITVEVSVNGRHIKTEKNNKQVFVSERIKGTGPYLE